MTKLFLDTNLWLRFFLVDHKEQYALIQKLLSLVEEGLFRPYASSLVFLEISFVLKGVYHLPINKILRYFSKIKEVRNITILEKSDLDKAIFYYQKYQIKFSDSLIASQLTKNMTLCTYNQDFKKIKDLTSLTPAECLAK